jgi:hypothetical protein
MNLDLTDEETFALLNLLIETIKADHYPLSPRIRLLRQILARFGEMAPAPPGRTQSPTPTKSYTARYLLQIASSGEWKTVAYLNNLEEAWLTVEKTSDARVFDTVRQEPV